MRRLLREAGVAYKVARWDTETAKGFTIFRFQAPTHDKVFDTSWWSASRGQMEVIADEVMHWDGSIASEKPSSRFYSREKASADFVQYVFTGLGRNARLLFQDRESGRDYMVQVREGGEPLQLASFSSDQERRPVVSWAPSTDGFKYCFSVPSTFLLFRRNGCVFASGNTGKTLTSTISALYRKLVYGHQTVGIMPPLLVPQWFKWLKSIQPALTVTAYRGTPKERERIVAEGGLDADFILVGLQIFKKDYAVFRAHFKDRDFSVIADEANFMSNVETDNHRLVAQFAAGHPLDLLTGTPANKPLDAYGLIKITNPGCYRNLRHFENLHVEERDFFEKPIKWGNLDLLAENLMVNSKRILYEDVFKDIEEPLFVPLEYELDKAHWKLYQKLADEQLLALPDGGKIDATSVNKLTHALGQIVCNHAHFSGDPKATSNAIELVKDKLDELGSGKLVVFANYKMTVRALLEGLKEFGAVGINSEVSSGQKEKNLERFVEDPSCRVIVIQFISGGKGLDGLQHVCHHCLFIEPCQQPRDFHQAVARLKRTGQRKRVWVGLAVAQKTLQVRGFDALLANDTLVNQVVRNATSLRRAIFGE
jgi:hypothetical protein